MEMPKPAPEHEWLKQLLGEWTFESQASMGPDQPPANFKGTESVTAYGDFWVVLDGIGEMPPNETGEVCHGHMRMTLGYDPAQKKYVGTWVGTMMPHLWVYDCSMDDAKKVLTLAAQGPSMSGEGVANYTDVIEIINKDLRTLTSSMQNPDGTWMQFMVATYKRK
jgi:hypothetical protein